MMAVPVALVLLLSALSASAVQWKPRVEYEFELSGRSLAGMPSLQGQYSGVEYSGRVRVQGLTADTAVVRLEKLSWSAMHARMQSGWWAVQPQDNETLPGHHEARAMRTSGSAAVVRFQAGQVKNVLVSRAAPDWEVNMLQGVLGHLQVQGAANANSLHGQQRQPAGDSSVFRVLESGVSGRCEMLYEISPANAPSMMSAAEAKICAGKPYVQITKTKNFTNCEDYAEQTRGLPRCSPAGNACSSLWTRNSVAQLIGCGSGAELQLVQSVSAGSMQAELQMRDDSRAAVFNSVNVTLARVQAVRERLPAPKDSVMLNGLGYRVAGQQVNAHPGRNADSSEEDASQSGESVEVVNQRQHDNDTHEDADDYDHADSKAKKNKKGTQHKKGESNESNDSDNDSNADRKNSRKSAKKNGRKHESNESDDSNDSRHKNAKKNGHKQESDESDDSNDAYHKNAKKNGRKHESNESDDSNDSRHKNAKKNGHKQESNVSDDSNDSKHKNAKKNAHHGKKNGNNSDDDDSNSSEQRENDQDSGKHKTGKSRKSRSANDGKQQTADAEDLFAGVLSPQQVRRNATLRAALQHHLVQEVQKAAVEMSRREGPSGRTLERVAMAVRLSRAMDARQLRSVQDELKGNADQWDLFRDVLSLCGAEPCVEETVNLIKQGKMNVVAAQLALAALPERITQPTRNILKYVQDLYQGSDDAQVKTAAALALGQLAGRSSRAVADSAAAFLAEKLAEQRQSGSLRVPLTYALGGTATRRAMQSLLKLAQSDRVDAYERAQAVLALRACAVRAPLAGQVRDALLALYHGPTHPAAVRMAAVSLLAYSKPGLAVWQRLAVSTFYEPNLAVNAYVWSTLNAFAQIRDPAYQQQSRFARLAMPLARRTPLGTHLAYNLLAASVDAQLDRMQHEHAAFMTPVDAASVYYRRVVREAGVASVDQEVDVWGANPDDLMVSAMEAAFGRQDRSRDRPASKGVPHSTRSIHDKLDIVRRRLQDPQGHLRLTLRPFVNNLFVTFDKDTPSRVAKSVSKYFQELRSGKKFRAQQVGGEEVSVSTVNEMGFPVNLRLQAPWVVRAAGDAQLHRNHSAQANITVLYASGLSAQIAVQPSWMSREYVAAVNAHTLVQLPATTLRAEMNATDGRVSVVAEPQAESWSIAGSVLGRMATQPVTASVELSQAELVSESKAAHNATRRGAPQLVELSPWEDISVNLRAPVKKAALAAWLRDSRPVLGMPVLGSPLTASRLELLAARPQTVNVSVALVKAMMQRGDLQVFFPASLRQNETSDAQADDSASTTTTEAPVTTTTQESTSTTTESESATTAAPAVRTPRGDLGARGQKFRNGSVYSDSSDIDFAASTFNATTLNPYTNRVNGSAELYVLGQVLAGMDGGRGYVVGVNVTASKAEGGAGGAEDRYSAFWAYGANLGRRLMRAGLFARNEQDNVQVAATGAVLRDVAPAVNLGAALREAPALMAKAELVQIDSKSVMKIVTAAMETSRSSQKTHRLWQATREQQCSQPRNASVDVDCRALLSAANTPDQYNVTVNYNNPAEEAFGPTVHSALQMARAYLWNQGNIAVDTLSDGNTNEIGAGLFVQADGTLDGWLKTPHTLTEVVRANAPVSTNLLSAFKSNTGAFCGVSPKRLHTLDGVQADIRLGQCWHVVAKDCSGKSRVAVLARSQRANESALEVEVNIDNYQVAQLGPEGALLNGVPVDEMASARAGAAVEVHDAADVPVMRIVRTEDGALTVNLPDHGLSVVYGNSSVVLQAGGSLRGRLCGMCGNFDGSSYGELLNPKGKMEKTVQAFADSYAISEPNCGKGRQ